MKNRRWLGGVCLFAAVALAGAAQDSAPPKVVPIKPNATFDRLKALAGDWEGTNGRGMPAQLNYRVSSGGTVVLETLKSTEADGKDVEMLTTYYVDGDNLMMTHYCVNTQPRMVGVANHDQIQFTRKDVTNYPGASYGAMRAMTLTWVSADEITQRWTWNQGGKDIAPELFQFQRKK